MPLCSCQSIRLGHDDRGTTFDQIKYALPACCMVTDTAAHMHPNSFSVSKDFYSLLKTRCFLFAKKEGEEKSTQSIIMYRQDDFHCVVL